MTGALADPLGVVELLGVGVDLGSEQHQRRGVGGGEDVAQLRTDQRAGGDAVEVGHPDVDGAQL